MGYIFVSYSRKQLYFAESIALHLQKAGFDIWFDLQKLSPGVDWSSALREGYSNCEKLVFVASKAAIKSPYVQVEWETALQNGREVIVILAESVLLPEALRTCAVYDARTHFDQVIQRLIAYLRGEQSARHDLIEPLGKFPLSLKMPFAIWFTMAVIVMIPTSGLVTLTAVLPAMLDLALLFYGVGFATLVGFGFCAIKFWNHTLPHEWFKQNAGNLFWLQTGASIACGLAALIGVSENVASAFIGFLFLPLPLVTGYWAFWFVNRSPDILRWFPSGQADQEMRESIQGKIVAQEEALPDESVSDESVTVTYAIHHDSADQAISAFIDFTLQKAGHKPASEENAHTHFIIVTNRTSKHWLMELDNKLSAKVIHILATPINSPPDIKPVLQRQWVDFRKARAKTVQTLAAQLTNSNIIQTSYAMQVSPGQFGESNLPGLLQTVYMSFQTVSGLLAGVGLLSFFAGGWMLVLFGVVLFIYFDLLMMRKVALPFFFRKILGTGSIWFACSAPAAKDPIGMDEKSKMRLARWFGFVAMVIAVLFYLSYELNKTAS